MERLTFDGNFCDIAQCRELPCQHGGNCSQKQVWERLKAYEHTGLGPEEVERSKLEIEAGCVKAIARTYGIDINRLRKLAEANKDGRMVLLPCKVDDTVYRIVRDADPHITRDEVRNMYFADDMTLCVELISGRIILPEKFGKTVFLTREEAEKALEAKE
jgi:hypothetical protein